MSNRNADHLDESNSELMGLTRLSLGILFEHFCASEYAVGYSEDKSFKRGQKVLDSHLDEIPTLKHEVVRTDFIKYLEEILKFYEDGLLPYLDALNKLDLQSWGHLLSSENNSCDFLLSQQLNDVPPMLREIRHRIGTSFELTLSETKEPKRITSRKQMPEADLSEEIEVIKNEIIRMKNGISVEDFQRLEEILSELSNILGIEVRHGVRFYCNWDFRVDKLRNRIKKGQISHTESTTLVDRIKNILGQLSSKIEVLIEKRKSYLKKNGFSKR
ncbi:MAG: hypothetical protein PHU71_04400 [Candidatus Gracilibacteria bacterium]|nr:hypothetical protein [Candidatus Gracilibacteria bacterium]